MYVCDRQKRKRMEKYKITINGRIGMWPNYGSIVRDEVESLKGKPINVYVNSPGGSVVDALEMYQAFREHGDVTVHIFGFTASAATLLAMGAKTVNMSSNALFLIHKASLFQEFWGSMNTDQLDAAIAELEKTKDTLNKVDEIIANIYALRAGGKKEDFLAKMKKAEWLRASDVKALGLADNIIEETEAKTQNLLTNEVKDEFAELKLPLPNVELLPKEDKPSFSDRVKAVLANMGINFEKSNKEDDVDNNADLAELTTTMNKTFALINAALGVEGVEADKEGKVVLTIEDLQKINDALATAAAEKQTAENAAAEKDNTIAELNTQVENLKKADGDITPQNEGGAANAGEDKVEGAAEMYKAVKDYI